MFEFGGHIAGECFESGLSMVLTNGKREGYIVRYYVDEVCLADRDPFSKEVIGKDRCIFRWIWPGFFTRSQPEGHSGDGLERIHFGMKEPELAGGLVSFAVIARAGLGRVKRFSRDWTAKIEIRRGLKLTPVIEAVEKLVIIPGKGAYGTRCTTGRLDDNWR